MSFRNGVVGKTGEKPATRGKGDQRRVNRHLQGGTQVITTCKEPRTRNMVKQVYIK